MVDSFFWRDPEEIMQQDAFFLTTSRRDRALGIMVSIGNHSQMDLVQVSEIL